MVGFSIPLSLPLQKELFQIGIPEVKHLTHYRPAMPFENRKKYFRGSFQFCIVTVKKYHPSGNLNFDNSGIFQSLKLRILAEKSFLFLLT